MTLKKSLSLNIAIVTLTLVAFVSGLLCPSQVSYSQTGMIVPQKGMCYVTWDKDRFQSKYSDESLEKLSAMGVDYVSIVVTLYQDSHDSTKIQETERTPTEKSLKHAVKKAHDLGLKVMLKPHLDLIDKHDGTYWRADIGFRNEKDWDEWFKEYSEHITRYARLAERLDVEIFCIGTELSFTTQKDSMWREQVISPVKKAFKGKLTYAANWDNYKNVKFWDELDYVGIDAYFPLSYKEDPSLEDLKMGWERWIYEIETWRAAINRPVIFTEIGYPSSQHAPQRPWEGGQNGNADPEMQALCYQAFFETVWQKDWLAGVYWWKWDTNTKSGGKFNRQFTPQNKPAQEIVMAHYNGYKKNSLYAMAK